MDFGMDSTHFIFCAPLQRLMDEHILLIAEANLIYEITEDLSGESDPAVGRLFNKLHEKVAAFTTGLAAHSRREEMGLFPMMRRHLGADDRTIETMEFEHEKVEQHLHDFLDEAEQAGTQVTEDDAQSIALNAVQAHATLIQHFAKEEKMLFPLAENILTANEKKELERLLQTL